MNFEKNLVCKIIHNLKFKRIKENVKWLHIGQEHI